MKRAIYLAIIAMFFSVFAFSQNSVGLSTGFNFANISQNGFDNGEFSGLKHSTFGTIGLVYKRSLDNNWSLSTGFNYSRRGAQSSITEGVVLYGKTFDVGAKLVHKMDYLELPLLFEYRFNGNNTGFSPYVFAGPLLSYERGYNIAVKAHVLIDINLFNYNVDISNGLFNRYDLSGVAGAGLSFPVRTGTINLDARYIYGFTDLLDNPILDFNLKHKNIRLGVSYMYKF